jgi:hypothetical protein
MSHWQPRSPMACGGPMLVVLWVTASMVFPTVDPADMRIERRNNSGVVRVSFLLTLPLT